MRFEKPIRPGWLFFIGPQAFCIKQTSENITKPHNTLVYYTQLLYTQIHALLSQLKSTPITKTFQ